MKRTLFILLIFISPLYSFGQGKLEKAEESLKSSKNDKVYISESRPGNSYSFSDDDDDENGLLEGIGALFVEMVLYITYFSLIESPPEYEEKASTAFITKYPYLQNDKGNFAYDWGADTALFRTTITNRFIAENRELYGNHLNVNTHFLRRTGVELDYLQLWEENTNFGNNSLAIFTVLAKYHRVRTEKFNLYWGIGATHISGDIRSTGFTYGLGAEFFFVKPLSIVTNFNQTLFDTGTFDKFNVLLNYHTKRYKFSGGYEHLHIGEVNFSTFSAGIGISF
ncbi:hypothetical protein GCM10022393_15960 [Aquimarina addita]|uniref:Outer membrane protein beta-barrel domain-containing protein n=1 Tax=Aquimarina addita TaxID=870485 RepID=A0ABP7XHV6_9FLAO